MSKRLAAALFGLAVLAVIVGVGIGVFNATNKLGFGPTGDCTATVNGHTVDVSAEQAENATLIASVAISRGLPARATTIALATAMQESKLRNLDGGDADSVGLFQQRPSQGWGRPAQLKNRVYATNKFLDALVRIDGYENLDITVAAQRVQRSAYPSAYAAHEEDARVLASALTGYSAAALSCDLSGGAPAADSARGNDGLTGRAAAVRDDLARRFGVRAHLDTHSPGTVLLVDTHPHPEAKVYGWALAQYLAGNAGRLKIRTIGYDHHQWWAGQQGWKHASSAPPDQVRVEVFG